MRRALVPLLLALSIGCGDTERTAVSAGEDRVPCADRNPLRNPYFGDLHVHTAYSWDAYVFEVRATPRDAYRFAQGEPTTVAGGTLRLDRPLDFAVVTDHAEFLGEVEACTVPGDPVFETASCETFRQGGDAGNNVFAGPLTLTDPMRDPTVCGEQAATCRLRSDEVWQRTIEAAEEAYDRSAQCRFTSFVGYEWTANTGISSKHRNMIFKNATVPSPITYMEEPTPQGLWARLRAECLEAGNGCDVLAIPHNTNQSNGKTFLVEYPDGDGIENEREQAAFRARIEPLIEIFQHKGSSECLNGVGGILGEPDEQCGFEALRRAPFEDCGEGTGSLGTLFQGCVSRRDYLRGILLAGLEEDERLGVNPFRVGVVASTDTHNGTPGAVAEESFAGHRGTLDDTPELRLELAGFRNGVVYNPGGLAGIWAEENSRESLFEAMKRRETFATSGPRMAVRLFGGFGLDTNLCTDPNMIAKADADGVPMGGELARDVEGGSPAFLVSALRDPAGVGLERIQIVKGWIENSEAHEQVFDVARSAHGEASVDPETCELRGQGADSLCTVWVDPEFQPDQHAFYYARVLQNPTCRWNTLQCNALPPGSRPPSCSDPAVTKVIQERAWSSPIWYDPDHG